MTQETKDAYLGTGNAHLSPTASFHLCFKCYWWHQIIWHFDTELRQWRKNEWSSRDTRTAARMGHQCELGIPGQVSENNLSIMLKVPSQGSNKHVDHPVTVAWRSDVITLVGLVCEGSTCPFLLSSHHELVPGVRQLQRGTFLRQELLPVTGLHLRFSLQQGTGHHQHTALQTPSLRWLLPGLKRQSCEMWQRNQSALTFRVCLRLADSLFLQEEEIRQGGVHQQTFGCLRLYADDMLMDMLTLCQLQSETPGCWVGC